MHSHKIPLIEAAKQLKTTSINTLMHIKRGTLTATEIDGQWLVDGQSLELLLNSGGKDTTSICNKQHNCRGCGEGTA